MKAGIKFQVVFNGDRTSEGGAYGGWFEVTGTVSVLDLPRVGDEVSILQGRGDGKLPNLVVRKVEWNLSETAETPNVMTPTIYFWALEMDKVGQNKDITFRENAQHARNLFLKNEPGQFQLTMS